MGNVVIICIKNISIIFLLICYLCAIFIISDEASIFYYWIHVIVIVFAIGITFIIIGILIPIQFIAVFVYMDLICDAIFTICYYYSSFLSIFDIFVAGLPIINSSFFWSLSIFIFLIFIPAFFIVFYQTILIIFIITHENRNWNYCCYLPMKSKKNHIHFRLFLLLSVLSYFN